ncbi:MAG: peptide deformylase [Candidatus Peribacteraceae bacterium]|nr:peptide deformylase [Candidatus Peribacteraceae bacterium]
MSLLPIEKGADNPILRRKAAKVPEVTKAIKKLIKGMRETVKAEDGAGLAAPQVGQSLQLCLALVEGKMTVLINPEITWRSEETATEEEGCLSLPGIQVAVTRPAAIAVKYLNENGLPEERKLSDFSARTAQHETDHLKGVLLVDYLTPPPQRDPEQTQEARHEAA